MSIRYVLLLEGIWITHLSIWQACSSMKACYELGNHIFNRAACQKSAQTSNSKEMRSFWSTAKISTFPLLVLDACCTSTLHDLLQVVRGRCSLSEKEIKIKKGGERKRETKKSGSILMSHDLLLKIYLIGAQFNLSKKTWTPCLDIAEM